MLNKIKRKKKENRCVYSTEAKKEKKKELKLRTKKEREKESKIGE